MKQPRGPDEYSLRSKQRFVRARRNLPSSSDSEDEAALVHTHQRVPVPSSSSSSSTSTSSSSSDSSDTRENSDSELSSLEDGNVRRVDVADHFGGNNRFCGAHPDGPPSDGRSSSDNSLDGSLGSSSDSPLDSSSNNDTSDDDDHGGGDPGDGDPGDGPGDDSSDDDDDGGNVVDPPLYAGAPITVAESMLSIMSLVLAHKLSGACLDDILELIAMHCPQPNLCQTSLYKFKKYFGDLRSPLNRRFYCSICFAYLQTKNQACPQCNRQQVVNYFIEIPVLPQVLSLYKRPGCYEKLRHRQNRQKEIVGNYEDIYDGSVYQNLQLNGNVLANENNISLTWNTDGVRIFKSSKSELWPFFLSINELPYSERYKIDNIVIGGLWYGQKKPLPTLFLRFIRDDLIQLRRGIDVSLPGENRIVRVRGFVICGTCDLPAKALFLNMKQFNGIYGCQVCKIRTVREHEDHGKRIYPFRRELELRTDEETRMFAQNAFHIGRPILGVKGPSALSPFVSNIIEGTATDVMHQCFLGVTKMLATIWFDPKYRNHPASLYGFVRLVDQRLCALNCPYFVQRRSRSISDHLKWWKAQEFKVWLLVYSLPLLEDVMDNLRFDHYKLLVLGISLLNMDTVSPEMVERASDVLTEFVAQFQDFYGRSHLTANLHLLLHLPLMVRRFGPLWSTSCFPFENLNGILKRLVSGTRFADLQIYSAASMFLNMSAFKSERLDPGRPPYMFCERLAHYQRRLPLTIISNRLAVVGKLYQAEVLPEVVELALEPLEIENGNFLVFYRLFDYRKRILFLSLSYTRVSKVNSTCVKYNCDGRDQYGIIQSFIRITQCRCADVCNNCNPVYYAIIRKCNVARAFRAIPGGHLPRIFRCTETVEYIAIDVACLIHVCFLIEVHDIHGTFVVEPINTVEWE